MPSPLNALLGQGARFVLGFAGFEGGLLCEFDRLHGRRGAPVGGLEIARQFGSAGLDVGSPSRPPLVQLRVDPDDLSDRALAWVRVLPLREANPKIPCQVPLQGRVVGLRGRDDSLVEHPTVDAQPLALGRLYLVGDRDVRVQIRVPGPAVAVRERGGHQALDVDLTHPVGAGSAVQGVTLDELQCVLDRCLVRQLDPGCQGRVGQGPQRADGLDRAERQVEPGDRGRLRARVFGDRGRKFAGIVRVAPVLFAEEFRTDPGADLGALVDRHGVITGETPILVVLAQGLGHLDAEVADVALVDLEGCPHPRGLLDLALRCFGSLHCRLQLLGEGVDAQPEQVVHLLGRDDVAGGESLQSDHPGADPLPRGFAALGVVGGQSRAAAELRRVVGGDLSGQVVIPAPGGQLVQGHHACTKPTKCCSRTVVERSTPGMQEVCRDW